MSIDIRALTQAFLEGRPLPLTFGSVTVNPKSERLATLIRSHNLSDYEAELKALDLDAMIHSERLNMLTQLTTEIAKETLPEYLRPMFEMTFRAWSPEDDDITDTVGDLFSYVGCAIDVLRIVVSVFPGEFHPVEIVISQMEQSNGLSIGFIIERVSAVFGADSFGEVEYEYMLSEATTKKNEAAIAWLQKRKRQRHEYATRPLWVSVKPGETTDLLDFSRWTLFKISQTPEVISEMLASYDGDDESVKDDGPDTVRAEKILDEYMLTDENGDRIELDAVRGMLDVARSMADPVLTDAEEIRKRYPGDPNRVFGPLNKRPVECISGVINGGCRMLTCQCREFDQDDDEEPDEPMSPEVWFTGTCDSCDLRIRDISHALRYPVVSGGWVGCFCSVECLKESRPRDASDLGEIILDSIFETIDYTKILDRYALLHPEAREPVPISSFLGRHPFPE